jgi:hypothetical protein
LTMRLNGTSISTGNRTLAARGLASVFVVNTTQVVINGVT